MLIVIFSYSQPVAASQMTLSFTLILVTIVTDDTVMTSAAPQKHSALPSSESLFFQFSEFCFTTPRK